MSALLTREVSSAMVADAPLLEPRPLHEAHLHAVRTGLDVVFREALHAAELAQ
jgi:hypothetical protein